MYTPTHTHMQSDVDTHQVYFCYTLTHTHTNTFILSLSLSLSLARTITHTFPKHSLTHLISGATSLFTHTLSLFTLFLPLSSPCPLSCPFSLFLVLFLSSIQKVRIMKVLEGCTSKGARHAIYKYS